MHLHDEVLIVHPQVVTVAIAHRLDHAKRRSLSLLSGQLANGLECLVVLHRAHRCLHDGLGALFATREPNVLQFRNRQQAGSDQDQ